METITLKIKRPSLSSVLSGTYDNSGIRETVIAEAAQMFIDDPEAKEFLKDVLDRGNFEVEDSYQMEGIQYELLQRLSDKDMLDTHLMYVATMEIENVLVKALDIANMKYKGEQAWKHIKCLRN